ncbi:phospholipase D1/Phospholipase D/PLD1/SPO14 [Blumeria hordei DH14]|uniref:Phospholipase D1 n=1 Tax=Blumeria graminis f. sp. hordei (strain DH14) TaxID=546991 RepID=N1JE63_BLUG1|nr:phospholipase D1/Phospholipase D/PLD1/SPO14 [Blumeria hordei DH14]
MSQDLSDPPSRRRSGKIIPRQITITPRSDGLISPKSKNIKHDLTTSSSNRDQSNGLLSRFRPQLESERDLEPNNISQLSTNSLHDHTNELRAEAPDYINGGQPHSSISPSTKKFLDDEMNLNRQTESKKSHPSILEESPEISTPPDRRSVQFARSEQILEQVGHSRNNSWEDGESSSKDRKRLSLISRLKSITSTGNLQSHRQQNSISSPIEENSVISSRSPGFDRFSRLSQNLREDSDADADAEETADEDHTVSATRARKKRRFRRTNYESIHGSHTAPTTPGFKIVKNSKTPRSDSQATSNFSPTAIDGSIEHRGHFSEGEGQDCLNNKSAWRRGSQWITNGRNCGPSLGSESQQTDYGASHRRPSNFRRAFNGLGGGQSEGETSVPKRPFLATDRATTFGAQRWRIIRQGLKILGQKKEEHKVDYLKSAELMAELRAGAPAALILASMVQRDEHGNKRIPVLLEQLKLQVTDSRASVEEISDSERHLVFQIALEYGSGINRMKWTIHRSLRDFANLHLRYKLQAGSDKYIQLRSDVDSRPKQPRFPRSAFPYFRGVRGLGDSDDDDAEPIRGDDMTGEGILSETERRDRKKSRPSVLSARRKSSAILFESYGIVNGAQQMKVYNERQRRRLEQYLQEMIRWLIFRADSNRLCRFLELSALGVRLAAEGSYHGKEGYLVIQSSKGMNMRRFFIPSKVFSRHTPRWFLVRHSYIVCVDSPENMQICDVYLVDPKFEVLQKRRKLTGLKGQCAVEIAEAGATHPQHHTLKFFNSERKVKLLAKNERQLRQFEESIDHMLNTTLWSKPNRFGSYAPVRTGIFAQWLVDGRDYMWNVSRAISMAKDVIYIHDWWLSPQLYMRRPAAISQKWRLDRLLQRKAREGVKIFIIIYRNVEAAIPIDSEFTKFSMLDLHPNIFVQRSPNQFKKNQFFYAHHEKICIVDHIVAFVGGIDLCFGRWDTPQHSVVDDKPTGFEQSDLPKDADHCQLWPGKDYSNPRVQDFFQLNEPYAEMYDRSKTPRMPWHDISMQVVGQPARDLTRHFVQRWNYVLRGRKPTRPTPFLLPPPDYDPAELRNLGLTGTCEVQILRSASDWSLGLTETEHSIMTAYCKMIEESEHYVYMENQFFISSCETMNVKIVNKIGDAIVERAIRAHQNNESWRCMVLIPLMPGFQNTVDEPEGTSVRLIMQCQFRSICRGEGSIFGRLRNQGIHPQDFVQFYSLRSWGRIGPKKMLVTEQLYIHAKAIIVDDRVALIGSANINERSMLGVRDSECAAIVRDTDMIWSTMDGQPYLVGRFAHSLRMRLMREHLGLDVDDVMEDETHAGMNEDEFKMRMDAIHDMPEERCEEDCQSKSHELSEISNSQIGSNRKYTPDYEGQIQSNKNSPKISSCTALNSSNSETKKKDAKTSTGIDRNLIIDGKCKSCSPESATKIRQNLQQPRKTYQKVNQSQSTLSDKSDSSHGEIPPLPEASKRILMQMSSAQFSPSQGAQKMDDSDIGGLPSHLNSSSQPSIENTNPLTADIKPAIVSKDCMRDPLNDNFFEDTWCRIADNNTKIFRRVFRCNPDSEVQAWSEYRQFVAYGVRFSKEQSDEAKTNEADMPNTNGKNRPSSGTSSPVAQEVLGNISEKLMHEVNPGDPLRDSVNSFDKPSHEDTCRSDIQHWSSRVDADDPNDVTKASNEGSSALDQQPTNETFPPLENTVCEPNHDTEKSIPTATRKITHTPTIATERNTTGSVRTSKRRRRTTKGSRKTFSASEELMSVADCEELLSLVQGTLVNFPYDWLVKEELNSNWLYQVDQVAPLQIYD